MTRTRIQQTFWLFTLAAALAVTGCNKGVWVTRYPDFYDEQITTVAVLSMNNRTDVDGAGEVVASALADGLAQNGPYRILSPAALAEKLHAAGMKIEPGEDPLATAETLRRLDEDISAFICGDVLLYDADTRYRSGSAFVWGYGPSARYGFGLGLQDQIYARHLYSATVAAEAALVRVTDGEILYRTEEAIAHRVYNEGQRPPTPYLPLRVQATGMVINDLVAAMAPMRIEAKATRREVLRTTNAWDEHSTRYTDDFTIRDKTLYVVIQLPAEADRNRFRVSVTRKGRLIELAGEDFQWSRNRGMMRLEFDLAEIAQRGGGPGDYAVRLASGGVETIRTDFEIEND